MLLKRGQPPILIINVILIIFFSFLALKNLNYEFIIYIGVIIFFFFLILLTNKKSNIDNFCLWGLTLWAFLHMAGGFVPIRGGRLYEFIFIKLFTIGDVTFFRYDHFVHLIGFGVATIICYKLVEPYLGKKINWKVLLPLIVLMGMGLGALNEIIEFVVIALVPGAGVGGYYNTMMDMVSNTLGAIIAAVIINFKYRRRD
jgi:uncharacterized membrane protein YjdF